MINSVFLAFWAIVHPQGKREGVWELISPAQGGRPFFGLISLKEQIETDYPLRLDLSGVVFKDSKTSAGIGAWTGISQAR